MARNTSCNVKCPFYLRHEEKGIMCEGVTQNSKIRLVFNIKGNMVKYSEKYCESVERYAKCPIYKGLLGKYEE